jgi:hypothetical protein
MPVDDRAARIHVGDSGLDEIEHRMDVHLKRQLPFLVADVADILECSLMGRVVDQDIDAPKCLDSLLDDGAAMFRTAQIPRDQNGLAALLFDERLDLARILMLVEIGDQDIGTLARIGNRYRPANTAVAARYHRFLSCKLPRPFVAGLAVVRSRVHLGG